MPTLSIKLPVKNFIKIKRQARQQGFNSPTDWARFLIEKNLFFEESPHFKSSEIITQMKKTGLYQDKFLKDLKKSLEYADKAS